MAKEKGEKRLKAKQLYLDSGGEAKSAEIAAVIGATNSAVRKWKCLDKWDEELKNRPKKSGGQPGNKNAKGHGAPKRNRNAEKHGAYSKVYFDDLSDKEKALIESITLDFMDNSLRELQTLIAKEYDLRKRIKILRTENNNLYTDRLVEMRKAADDTITDVIGAALSEKKEDAPTTAEGLPLYMETTIKNSAFEREMKLEGELNKTHGRIIKLIDSIKSYELESRRIEIEEKRYNLMKQKLSGAYEVDPDTGEIDDTTPGVDDLDIGEGITGVDA